MSDAIAPQTSFQYCGTIRSDIADFCMFVIYPSERVTDVVKYAGLFESFVLSIKLHVYVPYCEMY